jgi:hypothetical protein
MLGEAVRMALTRPGIIDIDHTYARADWTRCNSVNNRRRCDTGEFYTNIQLFVEPRDGSPDSSEPTLTHQEYESRSHLGLLNRLYALSNNSYDISDFLLNLTAELNKTEYVMQDGFYLDASEVRFEGNAQSYAAHHGIEHQPEPVGWFYSVDRRFEDWHYNEITQEYKQRTTEDRYTVFQCTAGRPCNIRLSCPTADCVDLKGAGDNFPAAVIVNPSAGENCSKLSGIPLEDAYDEATAVLPAGFDAANVPSGCRKPCYAVGAVNANPAGGDDPELSPNSLLEFNFETLGVAYGEPSHEYQVCFAAYDDCAAGVVGCVVGYNFAHSRTRTSDYWETATFAFVGPDRNQNYTCSLGWYCRIDPNGTRLSTLNMLTIDEDGDLRSCTRGDVETTFKGITSADGYKYFHEYVAGTGQEYWTFPTPLVPSNKYASFDLYYTTACSPTGWKPDSCAGAYTLCWAHDPRQNADYNIAFGRLHIAGPWTAPKFSCTLGLPCTATITGYLLPTVAGMSVDNPRRRFPNPPEAGSGILGNNGQQCEYHPGSSSHSDGTENGATGWYPDYHTDTFHRRRIHGFEEIDTGSWPNVLEARSGANGPGVPGDWARLNQNVGLDVPFPFNATRMPGKVYSHDTLTGRANAEAKAVTTIEDGSEQVYPFLPVISVTGYDFQLCWGPEYWWHFLVWEMLPTVDVHGPNNLEWAASVYECTLGLNCSFEVVGTELLETNSLIAMRSNGNGVQRECWRQHPDETDDTSGIYPQRPVTFRTFQTDRWRYLETPPGPFLVNGMTAEEMRLHRDRVKWFNISQECPDRAARDVSDLGSEGLNCALQVDPEPGFGGVWPTNVTTYNFGNPQENPGVYSLCWAEAVEHLDYRYHIVYVGKLTVSGVHIEHYTCTLGIECKFHIKGVGLLTTNSYVATSFNAYLRAESSVEYIRVAI